MCPERQHQDAQAADESMTVFAEQQEQGRPEQVELFFDAQRPRVAEARLRVSPQRLIVVADIRERTPGLGPVGVLAGENLSADQGQLIAVKGGEDPEGPAQVEVTQRDLAVPVFFFEQEIRKPLRTKNISTPTPPGTTFNLQW